MFICFFLSSHTCTPQEVSRDWKNPVILCKAPLLEASSAPTRYCSLPPAFLDLWIPPVHRSAPGTGTGAKRIHFRSDGCGMGHLCDEPPRLRCRLPNKRACSPGPGGESFRETRAVKSLCTPLSSSPHCPQGLRYPHWDLPLVFFHLYTDGMELSSTPVLRV